MDIPREPKSKKGRYIGITVVVFAVAATTLMLNRLEPAAPAVEQALIWTGLVERGSMLRQVRANGNLVPENIVIISAITGGRVEEVLLLPGAEVTPETVLLRLDNPDVELDALEAERQVSNAENELVSLRNSLGLQVLNQQATIISMENMLRDAERTLTSYKEVRAEVSTLDYQRAEDRVQELKIRLDVEKKTLDRLEESQVFEIAAKQNQVQRLKDIAEFQRNRFESLNVKAGTTGVVRELSLQVGESVGQGAQMGVIIQPGRLKAEVRVNEGQARDVLIGQVAEIDTRPIKIMGHVTRISPSAVGGLVTIDIALDEETPQGVYANQAVDAAITIEQLTDVLFVSRPINVQVNNSSGMFKIVDGGSAAVRVVIEFGRASIDKIEIRRGAEVGDELILSDTARWDEYDRIRIRK